MWCTCINTILACKVKVVCLKQQQYFKKPSCFNSEFCNRECWLLVFGDVLFCLALVEQLGDDGGWYVQLAAIWLWYLPSCIYLYILSLLLFLSLPFMNVELTEWVRVGYHEMRNVSCVNFVVARPWKKHLFWIQPWKRKKASNSKHAREYLGEKPISQMQCKPYINLDEGFTAIKTQDNNNKRERHAHRHSHTIVHAYIHTNAVLWVSYCKGIWRSGREGEIKNNKKLTA